MSTHTFSHFLSLEACNPHYKLFFIFSLLFKEDPIVSRWQMNKIFSVSLIIPWLLCGCSSLTGGINQPVTISTSLNGKPLAFAHCIINDHGQPISFFTPQTVTLPKKSQHLQIACTKSGYRMQHAVSLEHQNHLLSSAGKGVAATAGVGAYVYAPFLVVPIIGPAIYLSFIGLTAAAGGVASVTGDAITGGGYSLPDNLDIPMVAIVVASSSTPVSPIIK